MHQEILSEEQVGLLPLLADFRRTYFLVGGTAIALQIGHRMSIDFDLFTSSRVNRQRVLDKIHRRRLRPVVGRSVEEQLNLLINEVSFTFYQYPYEIPHKLKFREYITMPNLLDLAAMKAFALGRRSRWKDYVDLYFILSHYHTLAEISERSKEIFGELYVEKQFRAQLSYFDDINFNEKIEYLVTPPGDDHIKKKLIEYSTDF